MDLVTRIANLRQRAADIDAKLVCLSEQRKTFALGAVEGNKGSLKAIQDINADVNTLCRERETLTAAVEQARQLHHDQEAEAARREVERRKVEARKIADALGAANAKIDATMNDLRELFEHRASLVRQLDGTGTVSPHLILRMLQKFGATCAARAAGLHNFIAVEHVPVGQVRALAESTVVFRDGISASRTDSRERAERKSA